VQLGCLREENNQLKKDLEDFKMEQEQRLKNAKERANEDYEQL